MSLDFDRSPDGEPVGEAQVPAQQAPATADEERSPGFTPKHAAGEPADDEFAGDEFAGDEPTAQRPVVSGSVVGEPETAGPADGELADHEVADDELADGGPAAAEPVLADPAEADEPVAAEAAPAAATASQATAYHPGVTPAGGAGGADAAAAGRAAGTAPAADVDGPLLSDTGELQASWQRIQAAFIDDPREAVADAAGLVDQMGQMLVSALRQRQHQLRAMWDRDGTPDGVDYADSGSPAGTVSPGRDRLAADGGTDTEQLRLLIRRYRTLFNELCRP